MGFYEFAICVALKTKARAKWGPKPDPQLGTLKCHLLKQEHPLSQMHVLVKHTYDLCGDGNQCLILRVVSSFISCEKEGHVWQLLTLTHFKPFHTLILLLNQDKHLIKFTIISVSKTVLDWYEKLVHECQDQRDAEHICKCAALTSQSIDMTQALGMTLKLSDLHWSGHSYIHKKKTAETDFKVMQAIHALEQSYYRPGTQHHVW